MAERGKYCKAYLLKDMRAFGSWSENPDNARPDEKDRKHGGNGEEPATPRALTDNSIVYLQENYIVTDDCYKDEYILFDQVTPEWKRFCEEELKFEIPVYEPASPAS